MMCISHGYEMHNQSSSVTQESEFYKQLKAAQPFFVMAGPNVIQSEEHVLKLARQIKAVTDKLGLLLVFKSSFDKANRTSATSFRGPGLEEGLRSANHTSLTCTSQYHSPQWPLSQNCYRQRLFLEIAADKSC